jgi:hypothetical protein
MTRQYLLNCLFAGGTDFLKARSDFEAVNGEIANIIGGVVEIPFLLYDLLKMLEPLPYGQDSFDSPIATVAPTIQGLRTVRSDEIVIRRGNPWQLLCLMMVNSCGNFPDLIRPRPDVHGDFDLSSISDY